MFFVFFACINALDKIDKFFILVKQVMTKNMKTLVSVRHCMG